MPPKRFDRVMVHVEIAHHLKLRRLTDSEWKAFLVGVLPIAAKSEIRGALMVGSLAATPEDVAHQARVSRRVAASALKKLREAGMLDHDDDLGTEWVHDFDEWNPEPKADNTAAERAARYRAKQKARRVTDPTITASSHRDTRNEHGPITPPEVEVGREDPPNPPHGGRERDGVRFAEQLRSWSTSLLPDANPDDAYNAVRAAMSTGKRHGHPSRQDVLDHIAQWNPHLVDGRPLEVTA